MQNQDLITKYILILPLSLFFSFPKESSFFLNDFFLFCPSVRGKKKKKKQNKKQPNNLFWHQCCFLRPWFPWQR